MVERATMEALGKQVGADLTPNGEKRAGRPLGAHGEFESPKTWNKKKCETEIYKHRRELRELREFKAKAMEPAGPGAVPLAAGEVTVTPEMWGMLPAMVYDYMAERFGEYWKLQPSEIRAYGTAVEKVADKYMGSYVKENPELAALILVVTITTVPRSMKLLKDQRGKNAGGKPDHDGSRSEGNGKKHVDQGTREEPK